MAEQLKTFFSPALVRQMAAQFAQVDPDFRTSSFIRKATSGLEQLELLDRGKHIAKVLGEHLPKDYPKAIRILLKTLGPEHPKDELLGAGMGPFYYLPHTIFVAENGLGHFDLSMQAQYELTKRFTAEWSIRTFLASDPERTLAKLQIWANDENAHVRRLVSEGTRLRLPWASRVAWLDQNPARVLSLLELLKDDPAPLVRRSVANSLNDLSRDHPDLVIDTCRAWLRAPTAPRSSLVRHALRSLIKKGNAGALGLLGVGRAPRVEFENVVISPKSVLLGGEVRFSFGLRSTARSRQDLLVDYAVHFVKASGGTKPKVFKLKRVQLAKGESILFSGKVSLVQRTTRHHYPGVHKVEILVNGQAYSIGEFKLRP
jgi:3-methyladenine DNA glycosylase AlkC